MMIWIENSITNEVDLKREEMTRISKIVLVAAMMDWLDLLHQLLDQMERLYLGSTPSLQVLLTMELMNLNLMLNLTWKLELKRKIKRKLKLWK